MNTKEFRTRTIFQKRKNPSFDETKWVIALDMGYSAIKGMSENMVYSFPYYARKLPDNVKQLGDSNETDILYKDCKTGEVWIVGAGAQSMISMEDSNDSITTMYGRNRYFSEIFKVTSKVGIALGIITNDFGCMANKELFIQTGLPPIYLASDAPLLKEALAGNQSFDVKIGKGEWAHVEYNISESNIKVMSQPMGTLFSVASDQSGAFTKETQNYFKSKLLVFDPGFGTSDYFPIKNNMPGESQTFDNLGMKQVLVETSREIKKRYNVEISVPSFQSYLEKGTINQFDRRAMKNVQIPFNDILEEASKKICFQNIEKMKELYNYMQELDYLIITGGCGAAWSGYIRDYLKDMENLKIISGNQNDTLPYIFSNVRGYYMFMVQTFKKKK